MTPERPQRTRELFDAAVKLEPGRRRAFLDQACAGDSGLREELQSLLAEHDRSAAPSRIILAPGTRLGPYEIVSLIGAGGMGEVYKALDPRLNRAVAIKVLPAQFSQNLEMKERFERETKTVAALSHPNILAIFDIGMDQGIHYAVTELLDGETLRSVIDRGPLPWRRAAEIVLAVAEGLSAAHSKGIIHRDVKPDNIFVTADGRVKVLDFGIALWMPHASAAMETEMPTATAPGMVLGTFGYMSPEQVRGDSATPPSDVFSLGCVLYEMVSGRRAFSRPSVAETIAAVLKEEPPALSGSADISAVDLIVRRAVAKRLEERYRSAESMAADLRGAMIMRQETALPVHARVVTRLIVLPFRMLRPDADIEFLAFSLPDAITNSLFGLTALVVRSSVTASKYAGLAPDLKVIAAEAAVDVVLTGTILRSGDQLRVSAQLAEAPSGTVIWSETSQMNLKEIFQLQDEIVQRVVKSLELPLSGRESRLLKHDVPASPTAYELYLRANELSTDWGQTLTARDLYLNCVSQDPNYAPAWARLGRCYRVISKYGGDAGDFSRAEAAFQTALELNPDLTLAHNFYAGLEADLGRAESAMVRLVERSRTNRSDPNLFSGLVYACRFCGLLEASIVAHEHARRLDPHIPTSVNQSFFMSGDYRRALESSAGDIGYMKPLALASLGCENEALELLRSYEQRPVQHQLIGYFLVSLRSLLEGEKEESVRATERVIAAIQKGGEELFYCARQLSYLGELERAVFELGRAVDLGFFCYPVMLRDPWLDALRPDSRFVSIVDKARSRHEAARRMFAEAGGTAILGAV